MKVLFCAFDGHNCINGINTWLCRLLPSLRIRGIESQVLFLSWVPEDQCTTLPILRRMGFDCQVAPLPFYTERQIIWILEKVREDPPDIFVSNSIIPGLYATRWVKEAGIPTVAVLHNDDESYRAIEDEFIFGQSCYQASAVVPVSQALKNQLFKQQPLNQKLLNPIVRRIPCGVSIPEECAQFSNRLRLVYVGRLAEEQKRISEVTYALCQAVREVPDTEAVIYGSGPDQGIVEHILQTEGQGLPISLVGRVESDQMQNHLLESHIVVLLSDYEGLPVALMEAMACGVVPVCFCIKSGIPELVSDGENGLLVSDRGDEFVGAIRRLKQSPELWLQLSKAARAKIANYFSHEICADQWAGLFRELHAYDETSFPIQVPNRIKLPPVHPALVSHDFREPPLYKRMLRNSRMAAGKIKQKVLSKVLSSSVY